MQNINTSLKHNIPSFQTHGTHFSMIINIVKYDQPAMPDSNYLTALILHDNLTFHQNGYRKHLSKNVIFMYDDYVTLIYK